MTTQHSMKNGFSTALSLIAAFIIIAGCEQSGPPATPVVDTAPAGNSTADRESTQPGEYANYKPEDFASEDVVKNVVASGGVPMGRWKVLWFQTKWASSKSGERCTLDPCLRAWSSPSFEGMFKVSTWIYRSP